MNVIPEGMRLLCFTGMGHFGYTHSATRLETFTVCISLSENNWRWVGSGGIL